MINLEGKTIKEINELKKQGIKINILTKDDFDDIPEDELEDLPEITDGDD